MHIVKPKPSCSIQAAFYGGAGPPNKRRFESTICKEDIFCVLDEKPEKTYSFLQTMQILREQNGALREGFHGFAGFEGAGGIQEIVFYMPPFYEGNLSYEICLPKQLGKLKKNPLSFISGDFYI